MSVFNAAEIATIKLKNRIIRAATHEGMADENGCPTDRLKKLYTRYAKNDVGMIITGYAGINQSGKSSGYRMLMINNDECIPVYKEITDIVHEYGSSIILQIAHCGRQTTSAATGEPTVAPSAIRDKFYNKEIPHELTDAEIENIIDDFVKAISRAKAAGFDGVELHGAHGFLLSEFLSPYMNHRTDKWGGRLENRYRIIDEIYKRSKQINGDFPVLIKISAYDKRPNGIRLEESIEVAKLLEKSGCAGIEVSCGVLEDGFLTVRSTKFPAEAYVHYSASDKPFIIKKIMQFLMSFIPMHKPIKLFNIEAAAKIKEHVNIPIIAVGGIRTLDQMNNIIDEGKADFVSLSKPFVIEPHLVKYLKEGKQTQSKCIDCNYCLIICGHEPIHCAYGKIK